MVSIPSRIDPDLLNWMMLQKKIHGRRRGDRVIWRVSSTKKPPHGELLLGRSGIQRFGKAPGNVDRHLSVGAHWIAAPPELKRRCTTMVPEKFPWLPMA